ncbi:unnamed protein product [Peniophora sp. CBMAI 1063]|nr:unnamed protein product [Peniophora sp. CBMAI 1063]
MLSLLSRTASSAVSAARARPFPGATSRRAFAAAAAPSVANVDKLTRTRQPVDWRTLDAAVMTKSAQLRNEKQQKTGPTSVAETWADLSDKTLGRLGPPPGKYAGRSVEVQKGDLASALRRLNTILFENRVHGERVRNLRHEKKGYKRRRLASERWRRRFAHEVRTKVELVKTIRRRGA